MTELDFALAHRLNSVAGWAELGNAREARAELEQVPAVWRDHPAFLETLWSVEAREADWPAALATAERLLAAQPEHAAPWLHRAYALRRVPGGDVERAFAALHPALKKFPEEPTIPYNLACYACVSGRLDEARDWLAEAVRRGSKAAIKAMSLKDADLQPLWEAIRQW